MRLIRRTDVSEATGLRRSTIYKYIAEGVFLTLCRKAAVAWPGANKRFRIGLPSESRRVVPRSPTT
jgi:hypothetical protein